MLSGIGDKTALSKLGIPTVVNLPEVGKNLSDHPMLPNQFLVNSTNTFEPVERDAAFAAQLTEQWLTNHTGRLANTLANHLGWFRLAPNDPIFKNHTDPAAGSETSHFEMLYGVCSCSLSPFCSFSIICRTDSQVGLKHSQRQEII